VVDQRAIDVLHGTIASLAGEIKPTSLGMAGLPAVFARTWLVWCLAEVGAFAEGIARGEEAVRIAEEVDHPFSLVMARGGLGFVSLRQVDLQRAIAVLERDLELCETWHIGVLIPWASLMLGAAYGLAGRLAAARPLLERAVEQALELARRHKERGHAAWPLRLLGEIAAYRDPPQADWAEAHYRQAIVLAEQLGMRPLLALCHLGLGTLHRQTGRLEQARAELSTAIKLFQAMQIPFWLTQAEIALIDTARPRTRPLP
jgi:tetratricopeptide (TPR) repeat protein